MIELYFLSLRIRSASLGVHSLGMSSRYSVPVIYINHMHACLASKLCSKIDFLCPQTFCVFCIDRVDGSEVLLKLILGLKNHSNKLRKVWQVLDKLHTLLCTLWPRSAHYVLMGHAAAAVQVNGFAD